MPEVFGSILFSATDLMRFMGCAHSTALDLTRLSGQCPEPGEESEAAHLKKLKFVGSSALWPLSDGVAGTKLKRSRGTIHLQLFCRVSALRSLLREDCSIR